MHFFTIKHSNYTILVLFFLCLSKALRYYLFSFRYSLFLSFKAKCERYKKNYCKSKHFQSYCSLRIVSSRTNADNVHTKAALVWFCSFEVKMTRIYMCKRRQREMAMKRAEKLILQVAFQF